MLARHASLGALLGVLVFLACNRESTEAEIVGPEEPATEEAGRGPLSPASLTLPFSGSVNSSAWAFLIEQLGTGGNGRFVINNATNGMAALYGVTTGSGPGVWGNNVGKGPAGRFTITTPTNSAPALDVLMIGTGTAVNALAQGGGRAGVFTINNTSTFAFALEATTNGRAHAVFGANTGTGGAALFSIGSTSNNKPAVEITTQGTGSGLEVDHGGSSGNLAVFQANNTNRIRFNRQGKGFFNGGTQMGGADVAEAFAVEGRAGAYEPGDVLVISRRSDRRVEKTAEPYSTRVIGVYATKPGVLLTERGVDDGLKGLVPVGVIGVIPTKVSAENGPIRRGDLLVSARTPGYAMRADPDRLRFGMVLGKALGELGRGERGMIPVVVNVK